MQFAYHFVVFFHSRNCLSFPFPAFFYLFKVASVKQQSQETNMMHSTCQKSTVVCENKCMDIRRKTQFDNVRDWMLLSQWQRCYNNIISCLKLYSSCIKKMINPDGKSFLL